MVKVFVFILIAAMAFWVNGQKNECLKKTMNMGKCCRMAMHEDQNSFDKECMEKYKDDKKAAFLCVSDCVYKKTGAVTESGQLNKDKLKEMTDKALVGDDNADLRKVAEQAIEVCWSRQSADVEKFKAKIGDKAPCNIDPFVFSSCSFGYMIQNCPAARFNTSAECAAAKTAGEECFKPMA